MGTVRVGRTLRCLRHSLQQKSSCCFLMCCSRSPKRPKGGSSGHLGHSCCSSCLGDTKSPPPPTDTQCSHLEQALAPPYSPLLHASADALEQEPEQALPPAPSMALTFESDGVGMGSETAPCQARPQDGIRSMIQENNPCVRGTR